jgi:hypothetical protein
MEFFLDTAQASGFESYPGGGYNFAGMRIFFTDIEPVSSYERYTFIKDCLTVEALLATCTEAYTQASLVAIKGNKVQAFPIADILHRAKTHDICVSRGYKSVKGPHIYPWNDHVVICDNTSHFYDYCVANHLHEKISLYSVKKCFIQFFPVGLRGHAFWAGGKNLTQEEVQQRLVTYEAQYTDHKDTCKVWTQDPAYYFVPACNCRVGSL